MKRVSKTLNGWANGFVVFAIPLIIISILEFFFNDVWAGSMFDAAIALLILSPIFRGLSVLVQNAEEQIDARFNEKLENEE